MRVYNLLKGLAKYHQVTLLSFTENERNVRNSCTHAFCEEVHAVLWKPFNPKSLRSLLGYFSSKPRSFLDTYSVEMSALVEQILKEKKFDLVISSQLDLAAYYGFFNGTPALFEEVEVGAFHQKYLDADNLLQRSRYGLMWWKYRKLITRSMKSFAYCTVVSEQEKKLLEEIGVPINKIKVIPNSIAFDKPYEIPDTPEVNTLIFPGSIRFYANCDAIKWFLEDIYPIIVTCLPGVKLKITGDHGGITLPNTTCVILTGYVDDVKPLIARSWASLAPIRLGGGTRLKILESMSLGTPVVATSKAAEGLEVEHDKHLLIADDPKEYADAVIRLLLDRGLRNRLSENGLQLVAEKYNWAINIEFFLKLVELTVHGNDE
jgi:polysaccharide biosynthesis protein PslH